MTDAGEVGEVADGLADLAVELGHDHALLADAGQPVGRAEPDQERREEQEVQPPQRDRRQDELAGGLGRLRPSQGQYGSGMKVWSLSGGRT